MGAVFWVFFMVGPVDMTCDYVFTDSMRFVSQQRGPVVFSIPGNGLKGCDIVDGELVAVRER